MKLTCNKCGASFLVHGAHYWRYPGQSSRCRVAKCGGHGEPDKGGKREIRSRNREVNRLRTEAMIAPAKPEPEDGG